MTGPIQFLAATRQRLVVSVVASLIPFLLYVRWTAGWIMERSTSPSVDVLLITGWMMSAFAVAYLCALLLGDLLFPVSWREINVLGKVPQATEKDADLVTIGHATRNQALPFAILVVISLGIIVSASHFATQGFLGWYSRYGYATSTLRSRDVARKLDVLDTMARASDDRLIIYADMMVAQLEGGQPEVAEQAIWCLGEVARRMRRSIELMRSGQKGGQWVYGLHDALQKGVEPRLWKLMQAEGPTGSHAPALIFALGALGSQRAVDAVRKDLEGPTQTQATALAVLQVMADTRDLPNGIPIVRTLLSWKDPAVVAAAAWTAGEIYGFGRGDASDVDFDSRVVALLQARLGSLPFSAQCVVVDALARIRSGDTAQALFRLFERVSPPDRRCPRQEMLRRFRPPALMSSEEELRQKVVLALATVAEGHADVTAWLERQSRDPAVAQGLRDDMRHILKVLRERAGAR